jgi:hypothetical protein
MAPERQAVTHGASSQCLHWMAKETGLCTSNFTRLTGRGVSLLNALIMSFDLECWTVQWTSQSPHPMQYSSFAMILFMLRVLLLREWKREHLTIRKGLSSCFYAENNAFDSHSFSKACVFST